MDDDPPLSRKLREVIAIDPSAIALQWQDATWTWQFFSDAVEQLDALCADGDHRRVGVVLRNRPGHVAALAAVVGTGRTLISLSPFHGDTALAEDVRELRPAVVMADTQDWARAEFAATVASIGAVAVELSDAGPLTARPLVPARSEVPDPAPVDPAPADPLVIDPLTGVAVLMMTSGTTGRPSRVPLTYTRLTASFETSELGAGPSRPAELRPGLEIVWTPMVHIGGLFFALGNLLSGRTMAMMERFDVAAWADLVRQTRPKFVSLVPTAIRMVLDADVAEDVFDGVLAVRSGTAPLPAELSAAFEARYSVPVLSNYGATEFAGAVARWTLDDWHTWHSTKRGAAGLPVAGVQFRVIDMDDGSIRGVDEIGVLHVRGNNVPSDDIDGWRATTDLASVDADGFLWIHGRADDAINRGGFKIVPAVVEDALRDHPAVADVAVVGIADHRLGQVPVAAVTRRDPGATDDAELVAELIAWARDRLTTYQVPTSITIVAELPRTPSMKVSRPAVRALFGA